MDEYSHLSITEWLVIVKLSISANAMFVEYVELLNEYCNKFKYN